jgi:hypothetical protein
LIVALVVPWSSTVKWLKGHLNLTSVTSASHFFVVYRRYHLLTLYSANDKGENEGGATVE